MHQQIATGLVVSMFEFSIMMHHGILLFQNVSEIFDSQKNWSFIPANPVVGKACGIGLCIAGGQLNSVTSDTMTQPNTT